jgi:hypothetical protein
VTPTWFSKDDVMEIQSILVNVILEASISSNFANTSWVVDLGNATSGGGSTSTIVCDSFKISHK